MYIHMYRMINLVSTRSARVIVLMLQAKPSDECGGRPQRRNVLARAGACGFDLSINHLSSSALQRHAYIAHRACFIGRLDEIFPEHIA